MNAAVNIFCPVASSHANNISVHPPVKPPYINTAIGVPIKGATIDKINPVITAVLISNLVFLAIIPTIIPIAILTSANGISLGFVSIPWITLVSPL